MIYLDYFTFPDVEQEYDFCMGQKRTCYDSFYPFQVLSKRNLTRIDFEPVTILYGGNGCGKSTALNVMAQKLNVKRESPYNRSNFFEDYLAMCREKRAGELPEESCIITSDDVFDFMLNVRALNEGIDQKREDLFSEYLETKYADFTLRSIQDYEQLRKVNRTRSRSQSRFVRESLMNNVREHSNGESAFLYFSEKIRENALYFLDEPENSLSAENQIKLMKFIEDSARFFGCQFVIATHSPFLLSMKGAKIYDMEEETVDVKPWTRLKSVRLFYEFFKEHEDEF